jgi:hypothetical protein
MTISMAAILTRVSGCVKSTWEDLGGYIPLQDFFIFHFLLLCVNEKGHRNGEFEMATGSSNNSFIRNGQLYIVPTLTSDVIGRNAIFDGYTYNLTGCTNTNLTACGVVSNATTGTVINPVMSARISTKGKRSIRYGKVEVRAKLPKG